MISVTIVAATPPAIVPVVAMTPVASCCPIDARLWLTSSVTVPTMSSGAPSPESQVCKLLRPSGIPRACAVRLSAACPTSVKNGGSTKNKLAPAMPSTTRYTRADATGRGIRSRCSKRTGPSVATVTIQATSSITTKTPAWLQHAPQELQQPRGRHGDAEIDQDEKRALRLDGRDSSMDRSQPSILSARRPVAACLELAEAVHPAPRRIPAQ